MRETGKPGEDHRHARETVLLPHLHGHCAVVLTVDDDEQLVGIRADERTSRLGLRLLQGPPGVELHNGPARLLHR